MTTAERIQPDQDYADRLAQEFLSMPGRRDKHDLAILIRSTLGEEATEAWAVVDPEGNVLYGHFARTQDAAWKSLERYAKQTWVSLQNEGYTVRRVLVLEVKHDHS